MVSEIKMKVHPFLEKATLVFDFCDRKIEVERYGWSDISKEDALNVAKARCDIAKEKILSTGSFSTEDGHYYPNAQVYEEPVEYFPELELINTRNTYGAMCLNVSNVMFLDIDDSDLWKALPKSKEIMMVTKPAKGFWGRLFGKTIQEEQVIEKPLIKSFDFLEQRFADFIKQHPEVSFNLYRTAAGYRVIVLHSLFEIDAPQVPLYFEHFFVDELYAKLCFSQQCYRARLTPKPWRMGGELEGRGSYRFCKSDENSKAQWLSLYQDKSQYYATCHFVKKFGSALSHPKIERVVALHDERTQAHSLLPLA